MMDIKSMKCRCHVFLGHLRPAVGRDWSQVGVAGLCAQIEKNGYKVLYMTARLIGQASQTRSFLHSVTQGSAKLPDCPVLVSPNRLVESFTREVIHRKPHEFKITALSVSPTCRYIAAACVDGSVTVWDMESSTPVHTLELHQNRVYTVSFSPCERLLLSASLDKTVKVLDIRARSPIDCSLTLTGHTDFVLSASFSRCGSYIFSASKDQTVRRWDTRNPSFSSVLRGHSRSIISLAHSPTENAFATGCADLYARTWSYN